MRSPTVHTNNTTQDKELTEAMENLATAIAADQATVQDITVTVSCLATELTKANL